MRLRQLRPARSRLPAKAGEDLRVLKHVRYQGQQPSLQDVAKVQKRRQLALLHSKEGKLHTKGTEENDARALGTTAGKQGNNKPKKAAPQATKGTNAATMATGKGVGQKGKGKPQAPTSGANGGGGSRVAPARAAKHKAPHIVSESDDDDDDDIDYGSKGDLGWSKRALV